MDGDDLNVSLEVFKSHWNFIQSSISNEKLVVGDYLDTVLHYMEELAMLVVQCPQLSPEFCSNSVLKQYFTWAVKLDESYDNLNHHLVKLLTELCNCASLVKTDDFLFSVRLVVNRCQNIVPFEELAVFWDKLSIAANGEPAFYWRLISECEHLLALVISCLTHNSTSAKGTDKFIQHIAVLSSSDNQLNSILVQTHFCQLLAASLGGAYSSLPRDLGPSSDGWFRLIEDDFRRLTDLDTFLCVLSTCDRVARLTSRNLANLLSQYTLTAFLRPIVLPALCHASANEACTASSYLELCLRRIKSDALMRSFIEFFIDASADERAVIDVVVGHASTASGTLCIVSWSLLNTLIGLNCEEVAYHLIFQYLVHGQHVMIPFSSSDADSVVASVDASVRTDDSSMEVTNGLLAILLPTPSKFSAFMNFEQYVLWSCAHVSKLSRGFRTWAHDYDRPVNNSQTVTERSTLSTPVREIIAEVEKLRIENKDLSKLQLTDCSEIQFSENELERLKSCRERLALPVDCIPSISENVSDDKNSDDFIELERFISMIVAKNDGDLSTDETPLNSDCCRNAKANFKLTSRVAKHPTVIGPFLTLLFNRVASLPTNRWLESVLVISIVVQLASWPHPLLRCLLYPLPAVILQPNVRALPYALAAAKTRLLGLQRAMVDVDVYANIVLDRFASCHLIERTEQSRKSDVSGTGVRVNMSSDVGRESASVKIESAPSRSPGRLRRGLRALFGASTTLTSQQQQQLTRGAGVGGHQTTTLSPQTEAHVQTLTQSLVYNLLVLQLASLSIAHCIT